LLSTPRKEKKRKEKKRKEKKRKEKKRKEKKRKEKKRKEKKRKENTTPFGVNLMRSQVLYRAAQVVRPYIASCRQPVPIAVLTLQLSWLLLAKTTLTRKLELRLSSQSCSFNTRLFHED